MKNILEKIVAHKIKQEKELWEKFDQERDIQLENILKKTTNSAPFVPKCPNNSFYLIAECKKTSPSKGKIISGEHYNPSALAQAYEKAGAAAVSVLCEENFFEGSLKDLQSAAQSTHLPLLQKDFILHEKQLCDGKKAGASLSLLILRILPLPRLCQLIDFAREIGLGYLIEIYDEEDVKKVHLLIKKKQLDRDSSCLIGINNRNLTTFEVDFRRAFALKKQLPKNIKTISESGIASSEDLQKIADGGFFGALVGEMLMRSENQKKTLQTMLLSLKKPK